MAASLDVASPRPCCSVPTHESSLDHPRRTAELTTNRGSRPPTASANHLNVTAGDASNCDPDGIEP
jgi:hypothetical protein